MAAWHQEQDQISAAAAVGGTGHRHIARSHTSHSTGGSSHGGTARPSWPGVTPVTKHPRKGKSSFMPRPPPDHPNRNPVRLIKPRRAVSGRLLRRHALVRVNGLRCLPDPDRVCPVAGSAASACLMPVITAAVRPRLPSGRRPRTWGTMSASVRRGRSAHSAVSCSAARVGGCAARLCRCTGGRR